MVCRSPGRAASEGLRGGGSVGAQGRMPVGAQGRCDEGSPEAGIELGGDTDRGLGVGIGVRVGI